MGLATQLSYSKYAKKATGKCCDTLLPVNLLILDLWPKIPQNANPNFAGRAFICTVTSKTLSMFTLIVMY